MKGPHRVIILKVEHGGLQLDDIQTDAEMDYIMDYLRKIAAEVVESAQVAPGGRIPGWQNTTGYTLLLPGGNDGYPAFWVRDAAMTLGADFIHADEVEGWVRLIASVQAGPEGIHLENNLFVPPYSIPDHITLNGAACWYPGAMDGQNQGNGAYGFLPPADDAFYFIQMVREHLRLTGRPPLFLSSVTTPWGGRTLWEVCERAFESVGVELKTSLIVCDAAPEKTRVDWGFCDTVRKTGSCLMPSLLRRRAALDLSDLFRAADRKDKAARYMREAYRIRASIPRAFFQGGVLLSATGLGHKDDIWASAYAVWQGCLPHGIENTVSRHLLALYRAGGTVLDGQIRALPPDGVYGGYWEQCAAAQGTYQNGAYWGTPTGWFIAAIRRVDRAASDRLLDEFLAYLRANRAKGAPWECINPAKAFYQNPLYCASVALPYIALKIAKP